MKGMKLKILVAAAALLAPALPAHAQSTRYDVKEMNFDLWCQEEANLPPERCDKRLASDEVQFEAYRAKIEKYEVPYLQRREKEQQLDRTILFNDPIDNPIDKDPAAPAQLPTPTDKKPN
jgi:hypothetical protein